jgi:copper chaperone CopZ
MASEAAGVRVTLAITGMSCESCVRAITRVLSRQTGVTGVTVDLAQGRAVVEGSVAPQALAAAIERAGFGASLDGAA